MHVKLTLLLTNSMQTKQQIFQNENLKKINLPQLREIGRFFDVRHDPSPLLYTALSLSLTIYPSLHPYRLLATQIWRSCAHPSLKLEVLCASATTKINHSSTRTSASWWLEGSKLFQFAIKKTAMLPPCVEQMAVSSLLTRQVVDARRMHASDEW